jgi:probable rRNA maturation factor
MGFEVTISNRQRRAVVDWQWLSANVAELSEQICANLVRRLPPHLNRQQIKQIGERGSLSLILVSNRQIRTLNRQWRGKDAATDVLSFPLDLQAPPVELPWEFGEVIISVEKAHEQADSFGHSVERELAFLFVHGCLHVFGFDHEVAEEEKEMFGRQKQILAAAGLGR